MKRRIAWTVGAFALAAAAGVAVWPSAGHAAGVTGPSSSCGNGQSQNFGLRSTIAFSSSRDATGVPDTESLEIYLMSPDGANLRRLTHNTVSDDFPTLSPDGKTIVFDSDRLSGQSNDDDLFLMDADGSGQRFLAHGASATWSPDCKEIAFAASASGTGTPTRDDPGSATSDSDIFVANVDDLLDGTGQPVDITNSPGLIDDDADWSVNGQIVYTAHDVGDDVRNPNGNGFISASARMYVNNADGTGKHRLTDADYEERAPSWSPDATQVVYSCRTGGGATLFHVCVINADGIGFKQLTDANFGDLTASWSPDGTQILFHRNKPPRLGGPQLWVMNADGTDQMQLTCSAPPSCAAPIGGFNLLAHWGQLRVNVHQ